MALADLRKIHDELITRFVETGNHKTLDDANQIAGWMHDDHVGAETDEDTSLDAAEAMARKWAAVKPVTAERAADVNNYPDDLTSEG